MNFSEAFIMALRSMQANRLRSALTTLGIVIGVSAVIVLVGLGDGMQAGFNANFGKLGTQVILTKQQGNVPGGGESRDLKDSDINALTNPREAPDIASATPVAQGTGLITYNQQQHRGSVTGSTADYLDVQNRGLLAGQNFTSAQERGNARVVLLGPGPVADLFNGDANTALGSTVRVGRSNFKVIGVLTSDGSNDDIALMPLNTARSYLIGGNDTLGSIIVKASSVDRVDAAVDEIDKIMDQRHNIRDPGKRDFNTTALQSLLSKFNQFLTILTLFTVAVAGISLIVGAIGVANIMLVSVTERTREIGIRKAIGARRSAIMMQFLSESTVLAGIGGIVGIVIGTGITVAGAIVIPRFAPNFGAPQVSFWAILIAFAVSLVIGVVAGGYPANRAAKLQPIEALRHQ